MDFTIMMSNGEEPNVGAQMDSIPAAHSNKAQLALSEVQPALYYVPTPSSLSSSSAALGQSPFFSVRLPLTGYVQPLGVDEFFPCAARTARLRQVRDFILANGNLPHHPRDYLDRSMFFADEYVMRVLKACEYAGLSDEAILSIMLAQEEDLIKQVSPIMDSDGICSAVFETARIVFANMDVTARRSAKIMHRRLSLFDEVLSTDLRISAALYDKYAEMHADGANVIKFAWDASIKYIHPFFLERYDESMPGKLPPRCTRALAEWLQGMLSVYNVPLFRDVLQLYEESHAFVAPPATAVPATTTDDACGDSSAQPSKDAAPRPRPRREQDSSAAAPPKPKSRNATQAAHSPAPKHKAELKAARPQATEEELAAAKEFVESGRCLICRKRDTSPSHKCPAFSQHILADRIRIKRAWLAHSKALLRNNAAAEEEAPATDVEAAVPGAANKQEGGRAKNRSSEDGRKNKSNEDGTGRRLRESRKPSRSLTSE